MAYKAVLSDLFTRPFESLPKQGPKHKTWVTVVTLTLKTELVYAVLCQRVAFLQSTGFNSFHRLVKKNKKETEEKKDPFSVCPFSSLFQFGLGTYSRRGSRVAKKTHMSQFFSGKGLHVVVWEGLREVSVGFRGNLPVTAMEMVPTPLVVMLLTTVAGMSSAAPPAPTPPVDTAARNTIKNADASDHRVNQPNVSRLVS